MGQDIQAPGEPVFVDVTGEPTRDEKQVATEFLRKVERLNLQGSIFQATLRTDSIHIQIHVE